MADRPLTMPELATRKRDGVPIVMLTCYDALFARLLEGAGVDILLVGDSVNEVLAGRRSTLSATLDQMIYHAASVRRGAQRTPIVVDMPFLTYQVSIEDAQRFDAWQIAELVRYVQQKNPEWLLQLPQNVGDPQLWLGGVAGALLLMLLKARTPPR